VNNRKPAGKCFSGRRGRPKPQAALGRFYINKYYADKEKILIQKIDLFKKGSIM